jgi:hypothetical protein
MANLLQGYPRLMIENRVYSSRVFRKLHLEVAHRQDGLQVLHMVLFPRCVVPQGCAARVC